MKLIMAPPTATQAGACPYRVLDEQDHEVAWVNDFLDAQHTRQLSPRSLRAYAYDLLHFARWFQSQPQAISDLTESTLLDYVRHQLNQQPQPTPQTVNHRLTYTTRCPLGFGRPHRTTAFGLRLKQPQRVIQPLSAEQVANFWASFRTFRDLAVVGLMLLDGLRSCEILTLQLEDLKLADAQLHVLGKGRKQRTLPLPSEILEVLQNYLRLERPLTNSPYLFISLKGRRRGQPMTPVWTPLAIPPSSIAEHGSFRQSAPISTYFRSGHGARGHLLTRPPAPHGSCADSHHHALCPTGAPGHLARICARGR